MKKMTMEKHALRDILQENRAAHAKQFAEALNGYRATALLKLEEKHRDLTRDVNTSLFVNLDKPFDHTADYDRVLRMLDLDCGSVVVLTQEEFAHYVDDDWGWKKSFIKISESYTS